MSARPRLIQYWYLPLLMTLVMRASAASDFGTHAPIDLNADGVNDLWALHFDAAHLPPEMDDDGDGIDNRTESRQWSDPRDPSDASPRPDRLSDGDRDGLTDFEEKLLGFDPSRAASDPSFAGGDSAHAVALLSRPKPFMFGGREVSGAAPSPEAAARFFMQATHGADLADIAELQRVGFAAWLDEQASIPVSNTWREVHAVIAGGMHFDLHHAWWRAQLTGPDRLRQRLATALTEIYVISEQSINFVPWEMMQFYDHLGTFALGNWRDMIEHISVDPLMGFYLSHLKNRKADPALDRHPDENFAREIMQLFSIGLWELNEDGTRRLNDAGEEIPTYDNTHITAFARVFTGLSYGGGLADNTKPTDFFDAPRDYGSPMKMWAEQHDEDEKRLLNGVTLPAFAAAPGRVAMDDIRDALDCLFHHPNTAPFVSRLLIQRLVTSNPTPGYIRRVAQTFADNGSGVRGDLAAVMRSILLDPEARNPAGFLAPALTGRLREPYLRYVRLARTFRARSADGTFKVHDHETLTEISQSFYNSPSVFNFFLPDYRPAGPLAEHGIDAPEFQILNSTTAITTLNLYQRVIESGFGDDPDGPGTLRLDLSEEIALAGDIDRLLAHLNLKMAAGALSDSTLAILRDAAAALPTDASPRQRVVLLMRLIAISPDFAVLL